MSSRAPISPANPLLFLHVPKASGTSVDAFLANRLPEGSVRRLGHAPEDEVANRRDLGRHACYAGHVTYRLAESFPVRPTVVTILRDPIDRALSQFYYFRSLGRDELLRQRALPGLELACDLPLGEFLRAAPVAARVHLGNAQTWMLSQEEFYLTRPGEKRLGPADLDAAKRNLSACAVVGLTERLADSLRLMAHAFGWPAPGSAPWQNRTPDRPAAADLDTETLAQLHELTSLDAELYHFGMGLFEDRFAAASDRLPVPAGVGHAASFTFDGPVPGDGWLTRERSDHGAFCWSQREAWLEFPLAGTGELSLRFEVLGCVDLSQLDALEVSVNGEPVRPVRDYDPPVHRFTATARVAPGTGTVRLAFRAPLVRPCDVTPGSADARKLGVAVRRVDVRYAEPLPAAA
jgi:hypothetical protein